ncbi:MAG: 2'-5' RNA ligase family protein [Acidimicrobiales bacterium]
MNAERARLFVAAIPPAAVLDRIEALARPAAAGLRWTTREQWHVTLRFLGTAEVAAARAALARVASASALARLGPVVSRLGRGVLCLPCTGLDDLAAAVVAATAEVGRPPDPRPFTGHLTLARFTGRPAAAAAGERFEAEFAVTELVLLESRTLPSGAVYREVARTGALGRR